MPFIDPNKSFLEIGHFHHNQYRHLLTLYAHFGYIIRNLIGSIKVSPIHTHLPDVSRNACTTKYATCVTCGTKCGTVFVPFCSFCSFFSFFLSSFLPVGPQKDNHDPCILQTRTKKKRINSSKKPLCPHFTLHNRGVQTASTGAQTTYSH